MKKFVTLGTECVELLKAARASQGNLLSYVVSSACLVCLSPFLYSTFFSLFHAADALAAANARIASLEAELEASQKAWDVATATKATTEKSAKAATTKAKKAEKALADANQERIQGEEAITKRLNQVSALAGGKYSYIIDFIYLRLRISLTSYILVG
jgi:septal ring factor EnvC (AmiA/AmiB activator)